MLLRHDGLADSRSIDWEIEDFLPPNVVFEAVNIILKNEKYKKLKTDHLENRSKTAHRDIQILKYLDNCNSSHNPDKAMLKLDSEGRKRQICHTICSHVANGFPLTLNQFQENFLKDLLE